MFADLVQERISVARLRDDLASGVLEHAAHPCAEQERIVRYNDAQGMHVGPRRALGIRSVHRGKELIGAPLARRASWAGNFVQRKVARQLSA